MPSKDGVKNLIDKLYTEIMLLSIECLSIKRGTPEYEKKQEKKELLKENFDSLIKTHERYMRYLKVTGQAAKDQPEELINLIRQIETNINSINIAIPKS